MDSARARAASLSQSGGAADAEPQGRSFIVAAFEQVLTRRPTEPEIAACLAFLEKNAQLVRDTGLATFPAAPAGNRPPSNIPAQRARENLIHVLYNHNDFVTIR